MTSTGRLQGLSSDSPTESGRAQGVATLSGIRARFRQFLKKGALNDFEKGF